MPSIYETINLYNKEHKILPFRYIGSDQNDNPNYFGSNTQLKEDIKRLGKEWFSKEIIKFYDSIDNIQIRKHETEILKEKKVRRSEEFYNKSETYSPGCGVKGMKHTKKKIVSNKWKESRSGYTPTEETRKLWSMQRTGKVHTDKTREKMSKSNARYYLNKNGDEHPVTGYKHSEAEKIKRSARMKKRMQDKNLRQEVSNRKAKEWIVTTPSGKVFKIKNLLNWCKTTGNNYSTVLRQRKGWKCQES